MKNMKEENKISGEHLHLPDAKSDIKNISSCNYTEYTISK